MHLVEFTSYYYILNQFMLHICQKIAFCFTTPQKYTLKSLKYLIEVPPKRPATAFGLFVKQRTQGKTGVSAVQVLSELSIVWKQLPAEEKIPFQNKNKAEREAYLKIKAQYDAKYVHPFKRPNGQALYVKHLYQDNLVTVDKKNAKIQDYAQKVSQLTSKKTPEQATKYQEQAKQIRAEKEKIIATFAFPEKKYKTQTGYTRAHPNIREQDKKKLFQISQQKWKLDVKKWLQENKFAISFEEFLKLYNRTVKKQKKLKQQAKEKKENDSQQDQEQDSDSSQDRAYAKKRNSKR